MSDVETPTPVFDAAQQQIGKNYARALLAIGEQQRTVDQIVEHVHEISSLLRGLPQLKSLLESPKIPWENKTALLEKALGGKVNKQVVNFAKLLAKRGRFASWNAVTAAIQGLQDERLGRIRATVTTAGELSSESRAELEAKLSQKFGKQVLIATRTDPQVIGGVVVRIGDRVFDASVANRLKQIQAQAVKGVSDSIRVSMEKFAT
jgi:F-type H+-transporting ATPase subunit delta